MALDKAIEKGREHRRPYYRAKAIDGSCRNDGGKGKRHCGGQCLYCLSDRIVQRNREEERVEFEIRNFEEQD